MSEAVQVALITQAFAFVIALIPVVLMILRERGVAVSKKQEEMIVDGAQQAARFAEEVARKQSLTSAEKLTIALRYLTEYMARHSLPAMPERSMQQKIEAELSRAIPGHAGKPTTVVAEVAAPEPNDAMIEAARRVERADRVTSRRKTPPEGTSQ